MATTACVVLVFVLKCSKDRWVLWKGKVTVRRLSYDDEKAPPTIFREESLFNRSFRPRDWEFIRLLANKSKTYDLWLCVARRRSKSILNSIPTRRIELKIVPCLQWLSSTNQLKSIYQQVWSADWPNWYIFGYQCQPPKGPQLRFHIREGNMKKQSFRKIWWKLDFRHCSRS